MPMQWREGYHALRKDERCLCAGKSRSCSCLRMGWTGRAPAKPASMLVGGNQEEQHAMPRKFDTAVVTIGIDPGKNTLHLVGLDALGEIVLREKVARTK